MVVGDIHRAVPFLGACHRNQNESFYLPNGDFTVSTSGNCSPSKFVLYEVPRQYFAQLSLGRSMPALPRAYGGRRCRMGAPLTTDPLDQSCDRGAA